MITKNHSQEEDNQKGKNKATTAERQHKPEVRLVCHPKRTRERWTKTQTTIARTHMTKLTLLSVLAFLFLSASISAFSFPSFTTAEQAGTYQAGIETFIERFSEYQHYADTLAIDNACVHIADEEYTITAQQDLREDRLVTTQLDVKQGCSFWKDAEVTVDPDVLQLMTIDDVINAYDSGRIRPSKITMLMVGSHCMFGGCAL